MVGKYLFIITIFFFHLNIHSAEIIYEKNGIIISNQDLNQLKLIEQQNSNNNLLKKLIFIKKINMKLLEDNKEYYELTIRNIKSRNIIIENVDQAFIEEYLIYKNVQNDIARNYYNNNKENLNVHEAYKEKNIILGLSEDKCLTITRKLNILDLNKIYIDKILKMELNKNLLPIIYQTKDYDLCINKRNAQEIINIFNNYLYEISNDDFLNFIYDKN